MATETMFWYKRYEQVPARDSQGKPIPGMVIIEAEDCFNLYEVYRAHWKDFNVFLVWLKDGHEESIEKEYSPQAKAEMTKRGKEIPKERRYLLSQIELVGEDINRFKAATELLLPQGVKLPEVIRPHALGEPEAPKTVSPTSTNPMKVVKDEPISEPVSQTIPQRTHDIDLLPEEEAVTFVDSNPDNDIAVV